MANRNEVINNITNILYSEMNTFMDVVEGHEDAADLILQEIEKHMVPISTKPVEDLYGNVYYKSVYEWEGK